MQVALIVVDMQVDFCEGGALAASHTDRIIQPVNDLIKDYAEKGKPVIFSRDWHPENHCSFKDNGGQWPVHCVSGTHGAEFHPDIQIPALAILVSKAINPDSEAYSAFEGTGLDKMLKRLGVSTLTICGIATEYCVKSTVSDALRHGFRLEVAANAISAVAPGSHEERLALESFNSPGSALV